MEIIKYNYLKRNTLILNHILNYLNYRFVTINRVPVTCNLLPVTLHFFYKRNIETMIKKSFILTIILKIQQCH